MKNGPIDFYTVSVSRTSDGSGFTSKRLLQGLSTPFVDLTAYTNYTVEVTAFNTEGGQELPSPPAQEIVRTTEDAPSRPLNVKCRQQEDSCLVGWDRPEQANGIIRSFKVYYTAYPRPGTGLSVEADILNSGATVVDGSQEWYSFSKSDLASFSDFRFQVSATTTTEGANSTEAVGSCTTNAAVPDKPEKPVEPNDKGNPVTESTFIMRLAPVSQRNGPISCFEVTVVRLSDYDVISDVDPDVLYHPDMLGSFQDAHDTVGTPYVALVLAGHELSKARDITIGSSGTSECGSNDSGRRRRQTTRRHEGENGPLTPSTKYTAFIRAYAVLEDGTEEYVTSDLLQPVYTVNAQADNPAVIAVVCVLVTLIIIALVACGVGLIWRKKGRARNNNRPELERTAIKMDNVEYEVNLREGGMAYTVYEDVGLPSWALRWEILWKNLVVDDKVLGQGNFGEVRSGTVNIGGKRTKTAIKILKGQASETDRKDFLEEFRTMTNIGYHPNVVSLLGACQNGDVLYVALEFLPNGDLRSYLRTARSQSESDEGALSSNQLIKFALDVAKGMKHLSMSGVIHRDLAARNILLGERLVAKVSDFGLSRGEDIYVQTSMRRVPTRWLAIESLLDCTYTTQSDMWSFGILIWEIASIGGTPYATIATKALAGRLMEGYRMTKPANCDEQIYSLMLRCWEEDPSNRPSFSDLIRILSKMDDNKTEQTYMAIDRDHYENFSVIRPELDDN
ncbi:fibroblast growth factor receptor-like isoform X2 [Patiria miniata]|nr:fibroblast growth factor receptor-like isoform X2 [Patiria miniata]